MATKTKGKKAKGEVEKLWAEYTKLAAEKAKLAQALKPFEKRQDEIKKALREAFGDQEQVAVGDEVLVRKWIDVPARSAYRFDKFVVVGKEGSGQ